MLEAKYLGHNCEMFRALENVVGVNQNVFLRLEREAVPYSLFELAPR